MTFNSDISRALQGMLREHKVVQWRVAEAIGGRTQSYVSNRLSGRLPLSLDIVEAAAGLFGITPHELMTELLARTRR